MRICVREIPIRAFLVRLLLLFGSFGLAMGILARPDSPDMLPKRTKKIRLGINT